MTQFEKNVKVLAKYYTDFDKLIEDGKRQLKSEEDVLTEISDDGNQILRIKKGQELYYLNGKRNSKEPAELWVKWTQSYGPLQRNSPILMMGVGNPLYLEELVNKIDNKITIIVYEPSLQIFLKFLEMVDLELWMEKHLIVFWVNGLKDMDLENLTTLINRTLTYDKLSYMRYIILPNYEMLFPKEAIEFVRIARNIAREEIVQYNTKISFSEVIVKNLLFNARYLCNAYKTTQLIEVIPNNIPGILVAAGPSLNKNIKELKKAKGKAFIIAVDTAIKPLLREGIVPDMFSIIDGMKPLDLFEAEGVKEIPMLSGLNAAHEVLDYHKGMKFFYNENYEFAEKIFAESGQFVGKVHSGGSVATTAFSLMYMIGIDTIILVGQDLAFTDNKSHADGTFHEVMEEKDTTGYITVEGNIEQKVPTMTSFLVFLDWYKKYIARAKDERKRIGRNFRVINATEGGAKIEGTEIMPLKDAIDEVCITEVDIADGLHKLKPMLTDKKRDWAKKYLMEIPNEFHKLAQHAGKGKKIYQKLNHLCNKATIDKEEYLSIIKKIKKNRVEIEKICVYQLIHITMVKANYILSCEQNLSEDTLKDEGKEIARKGILYMDNVKKLAHAFEEYALEIYSPENWINEEDMRKVNDGK